MRGLEPPAELLREADASGIPLLTTPSEPTPFIQQLQAFLDERLR